MSRERVKIMAPTSRGRLRALPLAEVIAPNLALHVPLHYPSHLHRRPSRSLPWVVTQISSGLSAGHFHTQDAAEFFATRASEISPALVRGDVTFTEADAHALAKLRDSCGGWKPKVPA